MVKTAELRVAVDYGAVVANLRALAKAATEVADGLDGTDTGDAPSGTSVKLLDVSAAIMHGIVDEIIERTPPQTVITFDPPPTAAPMSSRIAKDIARSIHANRYNV